MKVVAVEFDDGSCLRADVDADQEGDYSVEVAMISPDGDQQTRILSSAEARFFGRALLSLHDPEFLEKGI